MYVLIFWFALRHKPVLIIVYDLIDLIMRMSN